MSDRQQQIKRHVDDTMALLERQAPIKAGPWFKSHVKNKLQRLNEPAQSKWSWGGVVLRPAILLVVVALNLTTVFAALTPSTETEDTRETYLNTLASEYQLSVSAELLETYETTTEP